MPIENLNILVLLRQVADPRPPAKPITRGAAISDRGLRQIVNPADLAALEEALVLKDTFGATVTVLAVGPKEADDSLRLASSMGADRFIRCWDHCMEGGDALADARVLARITSILKPTLLFTGNRLADRGDDPVPALAAALDAIPCIGAVVSLLPKHDGVEVLRKSDRGAKQTVEASFPCSVLFEGVRTPRYPSVDAVIAALDTGIETWELSALGLPFWKIGSLGATLPAARIGTPRPDPVRVVTPDAELPAFERIISLLSGGIKARDGKVQSLSADATAAALWDLFKTEGVVSEGSR
ncbi:MAG TPA: electron transfer flavoprotein subunit beta [Geomonas sp.]|nr:electron transfer flavoprotein subunit beta [Geomonas sp.]